MKKTITTSAIALLAACIQAQSIQTYAVLPAMTYQEAKQVAADLGGHLAFIQSYEDYATLVNQFETSYKGETFFLGIESGDLGWNWTNTDGTESWLNVWTGAFHIGSPSQPTGPGQVVTLRKFYSIFMHRIAYRPGLLIGDTSDVHRSIVVIDVPASIPQMQSIPSTDITQ